MVPKKPIWSFATYNLRLVPYPKVSVDLNRVLGDYLKTYQSDNIIGKQLFDCDDKKNHQHGSYLISFC